MIREFNSLGALVKHLGFENEKDFHHHVAATDISTPEKLAAFEKWRNDDGTKQGLLALLRCVERAP